MDDEVDIAVETRIWLNDKNCIRQFELSPLEIDDLIDALSKYPTIDSDGYSYLFDYANFDTGEKDDMFVLEIYLTKQDIKNK